MIKRFIAYYKPHRLLFFIDMGVALLASVLAILIPSMVRTLLNTHIPDKNIRAIVTSFLLMLLIYLVKMVFEFIRMKWGHILGVRMEYDMREDIFGHIQKLSFNYFDNTKTGHIMSRISNDLNTIAEVAHHAPEDLILSVFLVLGSFFFMFRFNAVLAFIALAPLPFMLLWGIKYGGKMRQGFRRVRRKIADINSTVENSVQGIREVKSYANEDLEIEKFENVNIHFKMAKEKMYTIMGIFYSGFHFLSDMYYLLVIAGGAWLYLEGRITPSDIVAFILYVNIILNPIQRLMNFTEQFNQGAASFERFTEIMDIEPDIEDRPHARTFRPVKGKIQVDHVWFKYSSSPDWILQDIHFSVAEGESVAIVGESGAGKSTIVSLIPRFYEPQRGTISIDGHDIMDLKQRFLRENIGLVQQNVFLFDGTIRENIMYGRPLADEEQMVEAARYANIYDFILSLPDGFDTYVGERGVKLSGGQKQRISIARVFLKNPPLLIFDEATSSLDTESESLIQEAMFELSRDRTTIIIAHRLSTVRHVDKIIVLNKGRLVEEGTHGSLLQKEGFYHKLYTKNLI
ncbi:MAG TPA: ABC transporter ATP-binding protein [Candidatus Mcinerneyibacteriales bacterium]|nr:ABC transporter ATP-binding protein [Candidatus Mcinerneyibacteriales bacterium]HPQ89768.1 ABC transporter ATP-binding protein [Candidatus Mcinerneyibacteriales bacterium]